MAFRDDLIALSARHDALAAEVAHKTRELDESRALLEQARARVKLPVLDQIQIASPCNADWSQMTGDERTRLWRAMTKIWPAYDEYQKKTSREIPVVVLERA